MAGSLAGQYPGAEEKSRGRHRPTTHGRSVEAADRQDQCARTQPGHDWGLKHFRSAPKVFGDKLGALPQTRFGGNSKKSWRLGHAPAQRRKPSYPATKDLTLSTLERRAPVFALGCLKPVGRLGALVPLERCVSCIMRCHT